MDDLISRKAVLELPRNVERTFFGEVISETVDVKAIEALPTVKPEVLAYGSGILVKNSDPDVIRVVRCKDCAWWQREWSDERDYHYCTMVDDRTDREFYCANAEREET